MNASRRSSACIVEARLSLLTAHPFCQGCSPTYSFTHKFIHFFSINICFTPFKHLLFEYSCFIMCRFLLYSKVNQQYIHIYPHFWILIVRTYIEQRKLYPMLCGGLNGKGIQKRRVYVLYFDPNFPICFTSSSHLVIHMFIMSVSLFLWK